MHHPPQRDITNEAERTDYVRTQHAHLGTDALQTPHECVYPIADPGLRAALRLDDDEAA